MDSEDPLGLGIKPITDTGFTHLGAPVGSQDFVTRTVKSRVEKVKILLEKLSTLENAHSEFVLLRSCFALPKISYLLRTCPPTPESLTEWERFDGAVRCAMNDLLATSLTDQAWQQAELPVAVVASA